MIESTVEAYLVRRAREEGDEVRKVKWLGRISAPDRLLLVRKIWIEVKRPGGKATFPKNAHERAQDREHIRLRKAGHRVEVIDSFEQVDEVLK
jgi:hypothetical protein